VKSKIKQAKIEAWAVMRNGIKKHLGIDAPPELELTFANALTVFLAEGQLRESFVEEVGDAIRLARERAERREKSYGESNKEGGTD